MVYIRADRRAPAQSRARKAYVRAAKVASGGITPPNPLARFPALVAARTAGQRAQLAIVGDSTSAGWGGNGAPNGAGVAGDENNTRRAKSWPGQYAALLSAAGIAARYDAVIGGGTTSANTTAQFTAHVPWVTFTSGWLLSGTTSVGGRLFENTTTTTAMTFTPLVAADSFEIYYVQSSGFATFTVSDSAGTLTTTNASGTLAVIRQVVTRATASLDPINIARTGTGGTMRLVGVVPFNSAAPMVEIWNMGWGGSQTANWNSQTNAVAAYNALGVLSPKSWVLELGANDANAAVVDATFGSQLTSVADKLALVAPVALGMPPRARDNTGSYNIPQGYVDQINALKAARPAFLSTINFRDLPFVANDYFDSSVHMTESGYLKRAQLVLAPA